MTRSFTITSPRLISLNEGRRPYRSPAAAKLKKFPVGKV
jgi:hypothetical protein